MDEEMLPNQFIIGDASVSGNPQYMQWIESVKGRYRQSQIKAHLQVNTAVLEFNWYLGRDISEIMRTRIWGSGVVNQVSLDLKAAFPEAQGFSTDNLYRMARFYRFYSEQKEIVAQVVQQIKNSMEINADSAPVEGRCSRELRRIEILSIFAQRENLDENLYDIQNRTR